MSRSLNDQENSVVTNALGNATVHFATIARVFKAEENSFWTQDVTGAAAVLTQDGAHYIKVVDLSSKNVVFSQELYQNFEYAKPRPFFHTFEMDDCVAGLSFADESDANDFYMKVIECKKSNTSTPTSAPPVPPSKPAGPPPVPNKPAPSGPPPRASVPPPPARREPVPEPEPEPEPEPQEEYYEEEPYEQPESPSAQHKSLPPPPAATPAPAPVTPQAATTPPAKDDKSKKKKVGLFGKLKSNFLGKDDEEEVLLISEPSNFRHVSNIGWNPKEGSFEINNIPPEWKKLFQGIGIKKSDLKNKETAGMIAQIIEDSGVDVAAPPPPPPPGPPPPPAPSGPPPPSGGPPSSGGGGGGGGSRVDLSEALTKVSLKKVDPNEPKPDLPPQTGAAGLADTLAKAMNARRGAIKEEQEEADDDWEDDDW